MADQPTQAEKSLSNSFADAVVAAAMAKGQKPQPNQVTAPKDLKYITYFDPDHPENPVWYVPNPAYDASMPSTTVYGSEQGGYFRVDGSGNAVPVREPNADSLVSNAVDRQMKEADRNARVRNEKNTGLYVDDSTLSQIQHLEQTDKLAAETLKQRAREFAATQKASDDRDAIDKRTKEQQIAASVAGVEKTGAETEQIKTQTGLLAGKTEADIAESRARAAQAAETVEASKQARNKPTVLSQGVEGQSIYTQGPGGEVSAQMRQGYVPKTFGEIAARTGQINAAMQAKAQELHAKIGADYTADQADADYQKWIDQVVTPENQTLQAATNQATFDRAKEQAAQAATAYNAATQAGTRAVSAYQAMGLSRVGDRAADVMNQVARGGSLKDVDWSNAAFTDANAPGGLIDIQQKAVADALKQIYPQGMPQAGADQVVTQGLDATQWKPSTVAGPAAAAAPAAGATPAAEGGLTPEQQIARRLASYQTEAATNQGSATPFQGIGNDPMAAAMARSQAPAEAIPEPQQVPAAAGAPGPAATARRPAAAPAATPAAPGMGYDPSNIALQSGLAPTAATPPVAATGAPGLEPGAGSPYSATPGGGYDPSNLLPREAASAPPPTNPFPGVQGLNVNGLNVNGLNLGGLVNGMPWPGGSGAGYTPPQPEAAPQPNAFAAPRPTPTPQPNAGIQGLNIQGLNLNGVPWDPYGSYRFPGS